MTDKEVVQSLREIADQIEDGAPVETAYSKVYGHKYTVQATVIQQGVKESKQLRNIISQ